MRIGDVFVIDAWAGIVEHEETGEIQMQDVIIVGAGNLSHALVQGWMRNRGRRHYRVLARSDRYLAQGWSDDERALVGYDPIMIAEADLVVLAVKPKDVTGALDTIAQFIHAATPLLSAVAGVPIARLKEHLPHHGIIRTMPNICSAIGSSVTGVTFKDVSPAQKVEVIALLAELGRVVEIPEDMLNPMTALFGSGPAYVYVFLEAIVQAAAELGIPTALARNLALEMVRGASELALAEGDRPFAHLVDQVVSPGGTTEAMLRVLQRENWQTVLKDALFQAGDRARQLGLAPAVGSSPA